MYPTPFARRPARSSSFEHGTIRRAVSIVIRHFRNKLHAALMSAKHKPHIGGLLNNPIDKAFANRRITADEEVTVQAKNGVMIRILHDVLLIQSAALTSSP